MAFFNDKKLIHNNTVCYFFRLYSLLSYFTNCFNHRFYNWYC